jgi:hypothetical protein
VWKRYLRLNPKHAWTIPLNRVDKRIPSLLEKWRLVHSGPEMRTAIQLGLFASTLLLTLGGCGSEDGGRGTSGGNGANGQGAGSGADGNGSGGIIDPGGGSGGSGNQNDNPATCAEAEANRTYVGCEFWPTVTYNPLYEDFDFAVVLANGGEGAAEVTVTGPGGYSHTDTVPAGGLTAVVLPWVDALKGPEFSRTNTSGGRATSSVRVNGGAYKVTTSVPVTAWQFNPLQFKKSGVANCSGSSFGTADCFSVSNDASLLVPASAMTGNYRVFSRSGKETGIWGDAPGGFTITAVRDGTTVTVQLGPACGSETWNPPMLGDCIAAGTGVTAAAAGDVVDFELNAGDVLQLLGDQGAGNDLGHADVSGTLIQATKPVQVIGFNPITNMPDPTVGNADHVEELILPAEVIGKEYLVAAPSNPAGVVQGGHIVRLYGNVDGTALTYEGTAPAGAPSTLDAGQVVELAATTGSFKVTGDQPFAVGSFMLGGSLQGSGSCPNYPCSGDPAFSMMVTPEQFRTRYTFLAPTDYDANYADVLVPDGATVTLDGSAVTATEDVAPGWKVARVALSNSGSGAHELVSDEPVGLQVMGFGHATSYYYPGGLNLKLISEPPPVIVR